jgi:hypothetical protein
VTIGVKPRSVFVVEASAGFGFRTRTAAGRCPEFAARCSHRRPCYPGHVLLRPFEAFVPLQPCYPRKAAKCVIALKEFWRVEDPNSVFSDSARSALVTMAGSIVEIPGPAQRGRRRKPSNCGSGTEDSPLAQDIRKPRGDDRSPIARGRRAVHANELGPPACPCHPRSGESCDMQKESRRPDFDGSVPVTTISPPAARCQGTAGPRNRACRRTWRWCRRGSCRRAGGPRCDGRSWPGSRGG